MSNKKYRPSNGTEGEMFMAEWCEHCARYCDENEDYCEILGLTFAFSIDDPDYPPEWTYDKNEEPCCTQYLHDSEKPIPRCTRTEDMFGD